MMKTIAVVAMLLVGACSKKSSNETSAFTSTDGQFSVTFAKGMKVQESTHPDPNKLHGDVTWHDAKSDIGAYSVMWTDFADAATAQQDVEDYIKIMGDRVISSKDIDVSGHKAKELTMKVSDTATMWIRLVTVDKREYRVGAGTKNDQAKAYAFLDTFKLTAK